jgi:hypothetical protein
MLPHPVCFCLQAKAKRNDSMNALVQRLGAIVKGVLSGFDRIVFKGSILPLMHVQGVRNFLQHKRILNKDYKDWMTDVSQRIVKDAKTYCQQETGEGITWIPSSAARKEKLARERQEATGIETGLIGVWSATESCMTYKAHFSSQHGFPQMKKEWSKCKHLYFYHDDADYGLMNIRLQTWFPYHIQVAMNGREWLRRRLEKSGIGFERHQNKFLSLDDYDAAQRLLASQVNTRWVAMLNGFLPLVIPSLPDILGPHLQYYWTLWQSEWATDYIFGSRRDLHPWAESLIHQAFMTGTTTQVLRYFDRPLRKDGAPYGTIREDVISRFLEFEDGVRVRHWDGGNSVKVYTEQNVLRTETTINTPSQFKVYRHVQGEDPSQPKRLLPMRKGVCDAPLRAEVSQQVNDRMSDSLAALEDHERIADLFAPLLTKRTLKGRNVRGLDLMGKDRAILFALSNPSFTICGVRNALLRNALREAPGFRHMNDKQRSAKVSRMIRLLRDHGILHKYPRQKRYRLSPKGQKLVAALNAILHSHTQELMKIAS